MIGGSLSDFTGFAGNWWGNKGAFLISYNLDKVVYIATISAIAVIIDAARIPYTSQTTFLAPILLLYTCFNYNRNYGSYMGKRIVNITPQKFLKIVLIAMPLQVCFDLPKSGWLTVWLVKYHGHFYK